MTNHERVGKALFLLKEGLAPFVQREIRISIKARQIGTGADRQFGEMDAPALLHEMIHHWKAVFEKTLGRTERNYVGELIEHRNRWAHQGTFTGDDAHRALDTAARLLSSVSATQAAEVERLRSELMRIRFEEQARSERRKRTSLDIGTTSSSNLQAWREVATPHPDVQNGRYQQADFAADLWQVHHGEGADEYRDPVEFFRRTFLTDSLQRMLVGAVRRLSGMGGDPVVQLQTNFGGGKTHSMLALHHLFSGVAPTELPGVEPVLKAAGTSLPKANRVVLVGTRISPGNPVTKSDGTEVRTLWGELAWQLGGRKAFDVVAEDDRRGTNPGDRLWELLSDHGPCLILIDEWVAYARQLDDQGDLPAGSFATQFTFAQMLTEAAKSVENCLLVVSLPASDDSGAAKQVDDVEVGGFRGREALDRLRNVVGRIEASWRPATAEESFEIVRRRLFEPMTDPARFKERDAVVKSFGDLYRMQASEFPPECRDRAYEKRIADAYPIHPEVFDRLYTDWSTLANFQRTRGVLRLMATVIHRLWDGGDQNPLILPAHLAVGDPRIVTELARYLPDNWAPVIEKDIDGADALPARIDGEVTNLGRLSACRRVARTVYLGSAPLAGAADRGIADPRIRLGCVMPGESPAIFGDALRRLSQKATYLYQDGSRYWYDTQPTVTKLAEERAQQLEREPDAVAAEIRKRLQKALRDRGGFNRVHVLPQSGDDVPDERETRLVVLEEPHQKGPTSEALGAAKRILESRGSAPRLYQNTLVFLAPDQSRLQDLQDAVRRHLAWASIVRDREALNLSAHQGRQAEGQQDQAAETVGSRIPEAFQWLLVPVQAAPGDAMRWETLRLTGQSGLAERASRRLRSEDLLAARYAGTNLKRELDRIPLWRGHDHVPVRQLVDDFAQYVCLPRLLKPDVLLRAVEDGVKLLTWKSDGFAYADRFDEAEKRFVGHRGGEAVRLVDVESAGLVVKASVEIPVPPKPDPDPDPDPIPIPPIPVPRRFHGTVVLDSVRVGVDASKVADEVIGHLAGLTNAKVTVRLDIEAELPDGAPDHVVRTVNENSNTLKFESYGFEDE